MLLAARLKNILPFYYGWVVVGASGTTVFARMAPNITTLTVFIYPLSQELGWSRTMLSGSVSAGALAALVLSPAIGWAIDRYGARPVLLVSMVVLGVAMTSLAWATIPVTFYLAYASARVVFHTPAPIGASTVVSRWFIRKRGRAIGIIFLCGAVGGLVFTMQSALVIEHFGTKTAWLSLGAVVFAVAVAPAWFLVAERPEDLGLLPDNEPDNEPDHEPDHEPDNEADKGPELAQSDVVLTPAPPPAQDDSWTLGEALKTRSFWLLFFMGSGMLCVNTGINTHIGAYYRDQGLTLTLAAVAISVGWVVAAAGSLVWGWLLERVPPRICYSLVFLILGTGSAYLLTVSSTGEAFVAACIIGMVSAGSNVVMSVVYADYFGRTSLGKIRGIGETGVLVGQSAGPLIAGVVFDLRGNYSFVFVLFAAIALACSLLVLKAKPPAPPSRLQGRRGAGLIRGDDSVGPRRTDAGGRGA